MVLIYSFSRAHASQSFCKITHMVNLSPHQQLISKLFFSHFYLMTEFPFCPLAQGQPWTRSKGTVPQ